MTTRILIVDDDDSLRESLELVLAAESYDVVTAENGETALRLMAETPIDIVLSDLRMPGIDGLELIPQISRRLPGATIILMSAYGTEDLAIESMKRGAYDYISKPFDRDDVLQKVLRAIEKWNRRIQEKRRYHQLNEGFAE